MSSTQCVFVQHLHCSVTGSVMNNTDTAALELGGGTGRRSC